MHGACTLLCYINIEFVIIIFVMVYVVHATICRYAWTYRVLNDFHYFSHFNLFNISERKYETHMHLVTKK